MVAIPQALEGGDRETSQIDGTGADDVVVNRIAGAESAKTIRGHRRAPAGVVVEVDLERALVVARARRRREADAAAAGLVPPLAASDPVSAAVAQRCTTTSVKRLAEELVAESQCLRQGTLKNTEKA